MAYTVIPTVVTGDVATAAWANTYLKNNFAATSVGVVTTAGDLPYATGANVIARLPIGAANAVLRVNAGATAPEWSATLSGLTLTSPVLTTPQINDTSADHQYVFAVSELAADRTITLPLLLGNDVFVFADFIQTLVGKTLTAPDINGGTMDSLTSLSIRSEGAAYDLTITTASVLTTGKTLQISTGDFSRTIVLSGNPTLADWFDQAVKAASSPTFANLTITSFAANWTNAGRTVADLGIVTTVDINGGTVDGVTIGGAAAGAGTFTTLTATGVLTMGAVNNYINDSANANMTVGLTINQGAADDSIFALKSSDVAHGVTALAETDTFLSVNKNRVTGGAELRAIQGGATFADALWVRAIAGVITSTRTTGAAAPIQLWAAITSGNSDGTVGANGNLVVISDRGAVRFIFDSDGDSHQDVGTAWTNYSDEDDVALLNTLAAHVTRRNDPLRERFVGWLEKSRSELERLKIVTFNEDGHHFLNTSKHAMLLTGAIIQLGARLTKMEQALSLVGHGGDLPALP